MKNLRDFLNRNIKYYQINREERNLASIFYHILLIEDNLERFLNFISSKFKVNSEEFGMYFDYAFPRDIWNEIDNDNRKKKSIIYELLEPINIEELDNMSVYEFNNYFGVAPKPSRVYIQSPANWSIQKFKNNVDDNQEFLKICKFKWAFNAKPDIVIHSSVDDAICIECKLESGESFYPAKESEIKEFKNRSLKKVSQTSLQKYIFENILGLNAEYIFLLSNEVSSSITHETFYWKDVFSELKTDNCPKFVRESIKNL